MVLRRWGRETPNLDLSTEVVRSIASVKRLKADVLSVSPSSERIKELWVALALYREWWNYSIGRNMGT